MNYKILLSLRPYSKIILTKNTNKFYFKEIYQLCRRLIIQNLRRPSIIITGLIQPILWLILFGSLFKNLPFKIFHNYSNYEDFLSSGIIIFSSFTGSFNAGLLLIFDREFGFLNRLLTTPIKKKENILISYTYFVIFLSFIQISLLVIFKTKILYYSLKTIITFLSITFLLVITISNLSVIVAFRLPGHIEFLAFNFMMNLPILFSSTTLAPQSFMPNWLQILSSLNLLTYGIESVRFIFSEPNWGYLDNIKNLLPNISLTTIVTSFIMLSAISYLGIKKIITNNWS